MKEDQRLEIISLFRPKNANGTRRTGGGVSIIYNPAKIRLKEYKINNRKLEILATIATIPNVKRKILIIGAYLPPNLTSNQRKTAFNVINDTVMRAKTEMDGPQIIIGGDFNKHGVDGI